MPYDLAALDRIEQRFVRRATSLFIETFDSSSGEVLDSVECTNAPQVMPSEVSELASRRLSDLLLGTPTTGRIGTGRTVLTGDSIVNNNNYNTGVGDANVTSQNRKMDIGWWNHANTHLGSPFNVVYNAGVAGATTGDVLARLRTNVLAYAPEFVLIAAGINDRINMTNPDLGYDYTVRNLTACVTQCRAIGATVFLCTVLPNAYINGLGAGHEKVVNLLAVNEWIRNYAARTPGVILLDLFNTVYDPSTICGPYAGTYTDNTHPGTAGAHRIGVCVATMIASYMGWRGSKPNFGLVDGVASATNLRGNTIKYGSIGGTGGTSPATYVATGNAPDGWWLQDASAVANAGHTAVMSRVPRDGYPSLNWWRSVVSWTAAQNSVATFTHRLTPAASYTLPVGYSAGDVFDAAVELQYSGTNAGPLTIEVFCRTGTTEIPGANMTWESGQSATTPTPAFSGVVRLNSLVFPAGADNFGIRVQARNLISTVGGYTLDLGRVIIAKRM